ncbi:hypothetical protein DERP_008312 [Dermatophagoides pteronyssinus]|uniref:Uncharacterized protein n=1 Tax=Dermatophagoides pteronyssinus TaxID=6956 RepID=A0ABQ8J650_DERPT|nr:hypothetical protein DERP_008312 [Dermatophagoides pteronyssinus]
MVMIIDDDFKETRFQLANKNQEKKTKVTTINIIHAQYRKDLIDLDQENKKKTDTSQSILKTIDSNQIKLTIRQT